MKNLARTLCLERQQAAPARVCRASDTLSPRVAPPSEKPQPKHGSVSLGSTRVTCSKDSKPLLEPERVEPSFVG